MTPTPDQVGLYRHLFGRVNDAYGEIVAGKVVTVRESVTEELISAHLTGSRHLGFLLVDPDGMVDRGYIDVDLPKKILEDPSTTADELAEQWEAARRRVFECACVLAGVNVEFYVESSRSKGFHLVVHTVDPIPAGLMKQLLTAVTVEAQIKAEVFPKQETRGEPDGLGNFVFGMLHGKSVPAGKTVVLNWQNGFHPVPDSWDVLEGLKRNSLENIGAALAYLQGGAAALSPSPEGCSAPSGQPSSPRESDLLPAGLLDIGFEKCTALEAFRWNATEAGRLTTGEGGGEHAARIALANYCRVFDGGEAWSVDAIFRHLDDYDPKETRKQLASLKGKPPLCRSLCPAGLCDDIKDAGGTSPIKFAFIDGRAHGFTEYADPAPAAVVSILQAAREITHRDFPAEVMTGAAGDFAHLYSSYMEVPKQFFFFSYLTCLGLMLSGSLKIATELKAQPRLYTLLLGESSDTRKSTAITKTSDFFRESTFAFPSCWGVGSAEGLQKRIETDNKLLLLFDEFMQFVGKCRIEGSVLLPCTTTLYENNYYESQTKKSSVILSNAHLAILAASTIETYEKTWIPAFTDIGFGNRLWLVTGEVQRKYSIPRPIPEDSKALARKKLSAVLLHAERHPILEIEPEAFTLYDDWYMGRPKTIHGKRLDTYALKFMALLAVNDLRTTVDVATVEKVIRLCDHQHHVRQQNDPIDADNVVARLEEKLRRTLKDKGGVMARDLKRAVHYNRTGTWLYKTALGNLMDEKEVGYDKKKRVYFLLPESVTTFVTTHIEKEKAL